jgi:DNA-binding transcriptional LysR family regulator
MPKRDAVTLRQLRALAAVAETGSLAAAAERLGLTAPAVHAQIRNLEVALSVPMLQRAPSGTGSVATPEGQLALEAARRIDVALSGCVAQIAAVKAGHAGRVTLGVVSTAKYFAPRLVATLKRLSPEVEVALREANRGGVIADLDRQAIDLAIMGRPPRPHPHGLIAPPDHPLAARAEVAIEEALREPMITREVGSGTRILMTRYLDAQAPGQAFELIEMGSNETIKQAVMAGLGLAFLSLHTVTEELRSGRLVALRAPGLPLLRQWFLVHPLHQPLSPAARAVAERIEGLRGSFLPS